MPTITSRIPYLIDFLVALFQNAAALGQAVPPVTVYDGPVVTADVEGLVLWVGLSDPAVPAEAASSVQDWAALGKQARSEVITIHCCAVAWGGLATVSAQRVAAFGIAAAAAAAVQAEGTQFGGNVLFPSPGITGLALTQDSTSKGVVARVAFDLVFTSRIG